VRGVLVRHVVAHVMMPVRLTPQQFGAEMAAAGGDFTVLSDTVAARDASLPTADLLAQLRSPRLHAWQPPGGGAAGAVSHAVIHSLDVTLALRRPPVAPPEAVTAVLEQLAAGGGETFGLDLAGLRLEAADTGWGCPQAEPSPMTWARPTFAPSVWRGPARGVPAGLSPCCRARGDGRPRRRPPPRRRGRRR
jgi:hypothetical protein